MSGDLFFGGEKTTRQNFEEYSRKIAKVLHDRGVAPDDVVAILMRNDVTYLAAMEACRYVGAYFATVNWHSSMKEIRHILEDSGAKVLIAHCDLLEPLDLNGSSSLDTLAFPTPSVIQGQYGVESYDSPNAQDTLGLIADTSIFGGEAKPLRGLFAYTAGSTGRPKGIKRQISEEGPDLFSIYGQLARSVLAMKPGDKYLIAAPFYHSAPNNLSVAGLAAGDVDLHISAKFDPESFLTEIEEHRISHIYMVPTMAIRLLKLPPEIRSKYDVSSLEFAISTGSPFPSDVKQQIIDWLGPIVFEAYGASEIGIMTLISSQESMEKPGSVGKPLPGASIVILDENRQPIPTGEEGEIFINLAMFGDFDYTNAEGDISNQRYDGHVTVGDVGYFDEDGFLFISDRKKDMIISGGANIFPAEIEAALIEMPEIMDCAVFGAPDPEFGETIVAAVQTLDNVEVTIDEVQQFLEPMIARFKIPKKVDLHRELPREDSGKIFKQRLREPYWQSANRTI
ncbi:MAG: AMP-binding protein [Pseudomonadota bacterium]